MLQPSEAHRQEKYWRILREGEVSPYKIAVVIFIRESYIHVELRRGSPEERCAQVRLMHQLITVRTDIISVTLRNCKGISNSMN